MCEWAWEIRHAYKTVIRNFKEKRSLGRSRCTWENNIKMNLREIGYRMDYLASDRV
jgi:hypothetical protein